MAACHVVVFPYPLRGHTSPLSSFSYALASLHAETRVTLVHTEANLERLQQQHEATGPPCNIQLVGIPDGLPLYFDRTTNYQTFLITIQQMAPALQLLLEKLNASSPVSCVVSDPNFPWVQDVANHFNLPLFLFVTDAAAVFAISLQARRLHDDGFIGKGSPRDATMLVDFIPGVPALPAKDLPFPRPEFSEFFFQLRVAMYDRIGEAAGVLLNTFYELETEAIDGARARLSIPILPVGPCLPESMLRDCDDNDSGGEVLSWLDGRPPSSVMYVCFGTLAVPAEEQMREIAEGLRASGQPFLWAIQSALAKELLGASGQGLVVEWAPQQRVLRHRAVGAFMTHCGWNSALEGASAGVPMLCLPLFLDQPLTCRLIVQEWRVGVQLEEPVERGAVERLTRVVLLEEEGRSLKHRALELRNAARKSFGRSPAGSSIRSLHSFIKILQGNKG